MAFAVCRLLREKKSMFCTFHRFFADHTLRQQVGEWLIYTDHSEIAQHLGVKARVEQMQNGIFNAADILINRHPVIKLFTIEAGLGVAIRTTVAVKIPRGFHKRIHRIRLPRGLAAALGTGRVNKFFQSRKRRTAFGA